MPPFSPVSVQTEIHPHFRPQKPKGANPLPPHGNVVGTLQFSAQKRGFSASNVTKSGRGGSLAILVHLPEQDPGVEGDVVLFGGVGQELDEVVGSWEG